MPFCEASKSRGEENGMKIFYRRYGHGSTKVLLIIGLAATHDSWGPQIKGLTGTLEPNDEEAPATVGGGKDGLDEEEEGIEVCCFDNRGVGRSSVPTKKSEYTTTIMAKDALALLDHLGWRKAHVFGHSMGAMIACKLAAIAPERLCSLALLNATGGGFECFPKIGRQMLSLAFRFLRAKTPEQRALVDLETHYTQEYLDEYVGSCTRRKILYQVSGISAVVKKMKPAVSLLWIPSFPLGPVLLREYVKAISSTGMQSNSGFEGQINACWTHKMKPKELDTIRSSGFLVSVIHGRDDVIAQLNHAKRLAEKLQPAARMVELHGGHLVSHERPEEVNLALIELIKASKSKLRPEDWSYLPERASGWLVLGMPMSLSIRSNGANGLATVYNLLGNIQLSILYFIGVFVMGFQQMRNFLRIMKPVRVAVSDS